MRIKRKMLSVMLSMVMLLGVVGMYLPSKVSAQGATNIQFNGDRLLDSGNYLMTQGNNNEGTITIVDGATVYLEIEDLGINNPSRKDAPCIKIGSSSKLYLTLTGSNSFKNRGDNCAAIDISKGTININGKGSLEAANISPVGKGAGIGGSYNGAVGNINISGGNIKASSVLGAGIGNAGASGSAGGNINISGGNIIASSSNGSDIGNGSASSGTKVKITGGSVDAVTVDSPTNDVGDGVRKTVTTVGAINQEVGGVFFKPTAYKYGFNDVLSDANKQIYLWLPNGVGVKNISEEFPDSRIANAVLAEINKNLRSNFLVGDTITKEMAESVKVLDLRSEGLDNNNINTEASLQNLNILTNLESLNLQDEQLSSIPDISGLTNLNELFLDSNKLSSLPDLGALTKLKKLSVSFNELTKLPDMSKLTNLESLNLGYDLFTSLPDISGLTNLKVLCLDTNKLTSLPLYISGLTNLNELYVENNHFTTLPDLSKLTKLNTLNANNNQIITLPDITKLTNLKNLWANKNKLIDIPGLSQVTSLTDVDLSGQKYSEDAPNMRLGEEEGITIPIVKEINDMQYKDFNGYTYNLQGEAGGLKNISGDVVVDAKGVIIPVRDIGFIGNYTLRIIGTSNTSQKGAKYSGEYIYKFKVGSAPVPAASNIVGSPVIVPSTSGVVDGKITKTGLREEMYLGILMLILGLGSLVVCKKLRGKKQNYKE